MTISTQELADIENRANEASEGPWTSFINRRDYWGGPDFIRVGTEEDDLPDMYISRDSPHPGIPAEAASVADHDFIAHARQDVPRLIEEIRRLQGLLDLSAN
jgi:hypothetical protein